MESKTPSPDIHMMDTSEFPRPMNSLRFCPFNIPFQKNYRRQNLSAHVRQLIELLIVFPQHESIEQKEVRLYL